jgi:hypothetical protein
MFKVVPDTSVPGFRVGLTDDNNESARRPLPTIPSGVAPGYDPYSNVLQAMVPTVVRPAGSFYQGNSGLFPTPNQAYVQVSGGSLSQDPLRQAVDRATNPYANSRGLPLPDPLRQAVDRATNPYANSGGLPVPDPLRQAVDRAANPYANSGGLPVPDPLRQAVDRAANPYINRVANPLQTILPSDINGQDVGNFVGGLLGAGLGSLTPIPAGSWLGAYVGQRLGRVLGAGTDFTADTMIDAAPLGANPVAP